MKFFKKIFKVLLISVFVIVAIAYFYIVLPFWGMPFNDDRHGQLPLTPAWALECWLWEDDVNTAEYVDELLQGYSENDIPVRTIIIDSPWSERYNDFDVDTLRYPNPKEWFKKLEDAKYRVVLWMTPNVNSYSNDARIKDSKEWSEEAKKKGYLISDDDQADWWKGKGGFIDYSNADALKWWHSQQQTVFDYGIDGWKLDGSATLNWTEIFGIPFMYRTNSQGLITTRQYMDQYYRGEYEHGLKQNPEFVTLSRSYDREYAHPEGFSPFDSSPINWVGDQKHTWKSAKINDENEDNTDLVMEGIRGIEMALEHTMASARLGYNIIGSDVAGFSGRDIPPRLYIRWTQFSTFCGLFMNGGHGERRLWKRTKEELKVIRKFSWLHTELVPYMYHYVVTAHNGGRRLQTPLDKGEYHYMFGDDFLVAPIYVDSKINSVSLPSGEWRYFFNDKKLYSGNNTFDMEFPMDEYPVFIKEGAIIPLNIKRSYTKIGNKDSEGFTTILIYPKEKNSFTFYHIDSKNKTEILYQKKNDNLEISIKGSKIKHILTIHSEKTPSNVSIDGKTLVENVDWKYNSEKKKLVVRTENYITGNYKIRY